MRNFFHTCLVITSLLVLTASFISIVSTAYGQEERRTICRACFDCPIDEDKKTVVVPENAVMLNEEFAHCSPDAFIENRPKPISLFIIIDHSESMSHYDPESKRYVAARALIDSIDKHSQDSEIGIAIFSNKLLFHSEDDPIFKRKKSSEGWKDSYIPLQGLSKKIEGKKAADKLKWALELDPKKDDNIKSKNYYLVNGNYTTSGRRPYAGTTDISIAFEAAIEALKEAKHPKERQFIVFFSDGYPQYVDSQREKHKLDYIKGKNVPCTFTAYFVPTGQPIPNEIKNMTENIKKNGYSSSNQFSQVWRTQGEIAEHFDEMIKLLKGNKLFTSKPRSMTINSVTSTKFNKEDAFFEVPFAPLNKDGKLKLDISYTFRWDPPKSSNETREYTVNIEQGDDADVDTCNCWLQGRIVFLHDDEELTELAARNQKDMEIRFYPPDGDNAPPLRGNSVNIELMNMDRSDKLELTLYKEGKYYFTHFVREYEKANKDDEVLQNSADEDSIIAIYTNPDIPMDIVYHGILSSPEQRVEIKKSYYLDEDANGFPDKIKAAQSAENPLSPEDCELVKEYTEMDTPRKVDAVVEIEIKDHFLYFSFDEPEKLAVSDLFTDVYTESDGKSREKLGVDRIDELPSGTTFPSTNIMIYDGMGPVIIEGTYCPAYITNEKEKTPDTLVVQFSESVTPPKSLEPLKFARGSEEYTMKLKLMEGSGESNIQRFLVLQVSRQPKTGDKLWINHTGNVRDLNKNVQDNKDNRRAPLNIKPHRFLIEVTAWPNPATPDDFLNHRVKIKDMEDEKGVIVKARVLGKWYKDIALSGSLQIFDGVGNLVVNLTGTSADDEDDDGIKESVIYIWDGANTNSRKVYSGGYFGIVTVTSEENYTQTAEIMLGVKSENTAQ